MAIYPVTGLLAAGRAMEHVLNHLKATGSSAGVEDQLGDFKDFSKVMGFQEVWDFDSAHADLETFISDS